MGAFLLVLVLGLVYVWRKGGLEWDEPEHRAAGRDRGVSPAAGDLGGE
jgi:hypothetical protein